MEISVLQSLIDRTSNEIAEYEASIYFAKASLKSWAKDEFQKEQDKFVIQYYSSRLPKLVKIQKALKKEIARQIGKAAQQRFYDSM